MRKGIMDIAFYLCLLLLVVLWALNAAGIVSF